jgi:pSer/pThr/pTyr-binding forkhead associated (FHA) protein
MEAMLDGPFGRFTLSAPVLTIGRVSANQLVLNDKKASGYHAEIRSLGQEGYSITDLGSTNGTFVNEQRLEQRVPRTLVNGEIIRVGDTSFMYVVPEVQAVTPTFYSQPDRQGMAPTAYAQPGQGIPPTAYAQLPNGQGVPPTVYSQPSSAQYNNVLPSTVVAPPPQSTVAAPPPFAPYTPQSSPPPPVSSVPASVPAQPQKRNLLWLWITLGGVGLLLVVIFIGVIVNAVASTPSKTLDAFCANLKSGDYHAAYTEFSPSYQQRTPERYFVGLLTLANVRFTSCTYDSISENGDTATTTLMYRSANGKSGTDQVTLTKDSSSDWKISYLEGLSRG